MNVPVTVTKHVLINPNWTPVQDWGQCAEFVLTGPPSDVYQIFDRAPRQLVFPYVPGPYVDGTCASAGFTVDDKKGFDFTDAGTGDVRGRRDYFNKPSEKK